MNKLIVPVYLNQKIVFDLLAMLQDGISTVTAITKNSAQSDSNNEKLSVGFGLSDAFSTLLKIDLSGSKEKSNNNANSGTVSEERVHTPASLFFKLRTILEKENQLKKLDSNSAPQPGDFIEFEGILKINPIVETLDIFVELLDMAEVFKATPQKKVNNAKKTPENNNNKIKAQMLKFSESLKAGNTIDLTSYITESGHKAVVTVDTNFLNDPMMSDLVDGQFKVMGKVIKSVGQDDSISLIRKTALSKMPSNVLIETFDKMSQLGNSLDFNTPEIKWEIEGPAIQIIPVAIYA